MDDELFFCYSPVLKNELKSLGIKWIRTGKHQTSKRVFWAYIKTPKLIEYLNERRKSKT